MCKFSLCSVVGLAVIAGSFAIAQPPKETKPASQPPAKAPGDHAMPEGMNPEDMKACMDAATPGKQHEFLSKSIGEWTGKNTMWMTPGAEPMKSECSATVSTFMDGRFTKVEIKGDMAGMPFSGFGINGFDNVSQKFQSTWVDNCGTGIMFGTGELSSDGKTMEWKFTANCPITKKPTTFRQIERYTSANAMTMEMWGVEPHSGKEFKMMEISYTRKDAAKANASATR